MFKPLAIQATTYRMYIQKKMTISKLIYENDVSIYDALC